MWCCQSHPPFHSERGQFLVYHSPRLRTINHGHVVALYEAFACQSFGEMGISAPRYHYVFFAEECLRESVFIRISQIWKETDCQIKPAISQIRVGYVEQCFASTDLYGKLL